jgi:carboxyl-terminal processing protease
MSANKNKTSNMKKLMNAEYAISEFYVDSVNDTKLVEDAIRGMLDKLDPHSSYSTAEETQELQQPLQGKFSGIGISFNMKQDTLYVISLIAGGPSERVGLRPGDRIVTVNDTTVAGVKMKTNDIRKRLMGEKGSLVRVGVKRPGVADMIVFGITRDEIPIYSVDASYMVDSKTGYVRISRFAEATADEFAEAFMKLKKQGMKQLILDLSDNGGAI